MIDGASNHDSQDRPDTWRRRPITSLESNGPFDVAIVGAGVNGAATARVLTEEGYRVLLIDKGDFAAGSSGRSSGLLHCGLRYLEPNPTLWNFAQRPDKLLVALKMARQAMRDRDEFLTAKPESAVPYASHFPIHTTSHFKLWQLRIALWLLDVLAGPSATPLNRKTLGQAEVQRNPLLQHLRNLESLAGVAHFTEYRFDWPERICVDAVLDAWYGGAKVRNYTELLDMARSGDLWSLRLRDGPTGDEVSVQAKRVFNAAGIWIDRVNRRAEPKASRKIEGTKGAHIVVKLPPEMAGQGIVSLNRLKEPIYGIPWRGFHYFGPTETHYDGDIDRIVVTEEEVKFLLDEVNHLLPGLALKCSDVLWTWAGVRPLGYDPGYPEGKRSRDIHDLTSEGLPGVYAMTAGPIMTHRSAGKAFLEVLRPGLAPSRGRQPLSRPAPDDDPQSPPICNEPDSITEAMVRRAARDEGARTLVDIMVRRLGLNWTLGQGRAQAQRVAELAAEELQWSQEDMQAQIQAYQTYLDTIHAVEA